MYLELELLHVLSFDVFGDCACRDEHLSFLLPRYLKLSRFHLLPDFPVPSEKTFFGG